MIDQLWRGSLLPLGREATLKPATASIQMERDCRITTASQSSGSKLPRHRFCVRRAFLLMDGFLEKQFLQGKKRPGATEVAPGVLPVSERISWVRTLTVERLRV
ncbi:hypothetical protein AO353_27950 [Pseudomonas fluorescens]|uniref:Uncharacterized protein n=1 Tax=Pseudomonas fluorescens TaxID=294 RepID=A0A0N9X251_PSEFL|nr:hypothetical protein AO353_27950 [Pseudomonas fluorescens]